MTRVVSPRRPVPPRSSSVTGAPSDSGAAARRPTRAVAIGELLPKALRELGVPSKALSRRVLAAWAAVADPAWGRRTKPVRLLGGALVVGVSSAPLRLELAQFHAERLLAALRAHLPDDPITSLRFAPHADEADEGSA